jgi:hypothetical protein
VKRSIAFEVQYAATRRMPLSYSSLILSLLGTLFFKMILLSETALSSRKDTLVSSQAPRIKAILYTLHFHCLIGTIDGQATQKVPSLSHTAVPVRSYTSPPVREGIVRKGRGSVPLGDAYTSVA